MGGRWGLDNYGLRAVSNYHCPLHFLSPNSSCSFYAHTTNQAKVGFKRGAVPCAGAPFPCKSEGNVSEKVILRGVHWGSAVLPTLPKKLWSDWSSVLILEISHLHSDTVCSSYPREMLLMCLFPAFGILQAGFVCGIGMLMAMALIMFYTSYLVLKSVKLEPGEFRCMLSHSSDHKRCILKA